MVSGTVLEGFPGFKSGVQRSETANSKVGGNLRLEDVGNSEKLAHQMIWESSEEGDIGVT